MKLKETIKYCPWFSDQTLEQAMKHSYCTPQGARAEGQDICAVDNSDELSSKDLTFKVIKITEIIEELP